MAKPYTTNTRVNNSTFATVELTALVNLRILMKILNRACINMRKFRKYYLYGIFDKGFDMALCF